MPQLYDAFISYGRADSKAFAEPLCQLLTKQGYRIWFDQNDIPLGVDYQQQIDDDLERSHNFVFIMSPHSVNSDYCRLEVERAVARHKRIIPILHVDELPRETWQQRNPEGTEAEWAEYQAQKLHLGDVRNPRIHPIIGKLNWIYMRENQDDLKAGLAGLIKILERQKDYVEHHTQILVKALEWEDQQRRSQFLLIGNQREQAEQWLKVRFNDDLPPCTPSDLHGEFITESIKNANNLMCQVFLAHAAEDRAVMEKVRRSLWREGLTVWTYDSDIEMGSDFRQAIQEGIEQADNLVYLLSPDSIVSEYCQQELEYALSLKKRVIPILVRPTPLNQQPQRLKELQYIDLTDNEREEDYLLDESQLLRILRTNEQYFNTHKVFLAKALKWVRQHRNPSLLLRGYNLKQAETWLKTASKRSTYLPTQIQSEFITESLRQPPAESLDVFISYSRSDSEFARKLNENLQVYGKLTWFDQESIAMASADFQQEINRGIEASDNFVFILSPQSVNSPYCKDEVEYAANLNKRIITVLHQPVDASNLHPELAKVQWLDFTDPDREFSDHFNQIVRVLETDRDHVHSHTKWSQRAIEWEHKDRSEDLLLRGKEYALAADWLNIATEEEKQPKPTDLQTAFIHASEQDIKARTEKENAQKWRSRSLVAVLSLAVATGFWINANARKAVQKNIRTEIAAANSSFAHGNYRAALLNGLRAARTFRNNDWLDKDEKIQPWLVNALQQPLYRIHSQNRLVGHNTLPVGLNFSADGEHLVSIDETGQGFLWSQAGEQLQRLDLDDTPLQDTSFYFSNVSNISVDLEARTITLQAWDSRQVWTLDGKYVPANKDENAVFLEQRVWSPNGQYFTSKDFEGAVSLWEIGDDGSEQPIALPGQYYSESAIAFSADSALLALGNQTNGNIDIFSMAGELVGSFPTQLLPPDPNQSPVKAGSREQQRMSAEGTAFQEPGFHPDQPPLYPDGFEQDTRRSQPKFTQEVVNIAISSDQQFLSVIQQDTATSGEHLITVWTTDGHNTVLPGGDEVNPYIPMVFSPNGQFLALPFWDDTIALWDLYTFQEKILSGHTDELTKLQFSPDSTLLASTGYDNTIELWRVTNSLTKQWQNTGAITLPPALDYPVSAYERDRSEGGYIFEKYINDTVTIEVWSTDGTLKFQLDGLAYVSNVRISNDGQTVVTAEVVTTYLDENGNAMTPDANGEIYDYYDYEDKITVKVWNGDGSLRFTFNDFELFYDVLLAGDGKTFITLGDTTMKQWNIDGTLNQVLIPDTGEYINATSSASGQSIVINHFGSELQHWSASGQRLHTLTAADYQPLLDSDGDFSIEENEIWNFFISEAEDAIVLTFYNDELIHWVFGDPPQRISEEEWYAMSDEFPELTGVDSSEGSYYSPDSQWEAIVTSTNSRQMIKLVSYGDGEDVTFDAGHRKDISNVQFSPDGDYLATASWDSTIKLWDLDELEPETSPRPQMIFRDHAGYLSHFSSGGDFLVTADENYDVFIARALEGMNDLDRLVQRACGQLNDFLTSEQGDRTWNDDLLPSEDAWQSGDRTLCDGIDIEFPADWPQVPDIEVDQSTIFVSTDDDPYP